MKVWLIVVLGALLTGITYAAYEIELAGRIGRTADAVATGDKTTSAQAPESIIDAEKERAAGGKGTGSTKSTTGTLVAADNSQPVETPEPPATLETPETQATLETPEPAAPTAELPSGEDMPDPGSATVAGAAIGDSSVSPTSPASPASPTLSASPIPPISPALPEKEAPTQPTFDVVSVDPDGTAVVAGRAEPGASVTLNLGAKEIGKTQASERGEWVIVPHKPLSGGTAVLALQATPRGDSTTVRSAQTVTVVLPEREPAEPSTEIDLSKPSPKADEPEMRQAGLSANTTDEVDARPSSKPTASVAVSIDTAVAESDAQPTGRPPPPDTAVSVSEGSDAPSPPAIESETTTAMADVSKPKPTPPSATVPGPMVVLSEPNNPSRVLQRAEEMDEPRGPVTFESVDYDDSGQIIVAGRTGPDADIRAYIDNQLLGDARADSKGQWTLRATRDIKPGAYELRVDQIGSEGVVTARVAAPFERAEPDIVARARSRGQVVIQPGDNLWNIARSIYGIGTQYTVIYNANTNQIGNPDLIYPGQVLVTPGGAPPGDADTASAG